MTPFPISVVNGVPNVPATEKSIDDTDSPNNAMVLINTPIALATVAPPTANDDVGDNNNWSWQ